jgi:4-oxalocrotonate tautomerase
MPIITVDMWSGVEKETAEKLITDITEIFVKRGIPSDAVQVLIRQTPKTHWGIGGVACSEKFPERNVPK